MNEDNGYRKLKISGEILKSLFNFKIGSETRYSMSFIASVAIHVILFFLLFVSLDTTFNPQKMNGQRGEIVQAVVVDNKLVEAEINRIKLEQTQEKDKQERHQKMLAQKAEHLKKESQKEEARLEKLKSELLKTKQEEEARLAEIKVAKAKEQKQLEALKNEKSKEQKRLAAIDDQRQAEVERAAEMRKQREKEEKIKTDAAAKQEAEGKRKASEANQQRITSEVQRVLGEWSEKIRQNKLVMSNMPPELKCELSVVVLPDGNVQVRLTKPSGNPVFDDLSIKAVYKSQPFQLPEDPSVREQVRTFDLGLQNDETAG